MLGERWVQAGLLASVDSPFVAAASHLVQNSLELVAGEAGRGGRTHAARAWLTRFTSPLPAPCPDADTELRQLLAYPLEETLASGAAAAVLGDNFQQVAAAVLDAHDSGALAEALGSGHDGYKARARVECSAGQG